MVVSEGVEPSRRANQALSLVYKARLHAGAADNKLVRHPGLEPGRFLRHRVLNPACLPFHQQRNKIGTQREI